MLLQLLILIIIINYKLVKNSVLVFGVTLKCQVEMAKQGLFPSNPAKVVTFQQKFQGIKGDYGDRCHYFSL